MASSSPRSNSIRNIAISAGMLIVPRSTDPAANLIELDGARQFYGFATAQTLKEPRSPLAEDGMGVVRKRAGTHGPPPMEVNPAGCGEVKVFELPLMLSFPPTIWG
jgi:hypothetical protein